MAVTLKRPHRHGAAITIVPMIDLMTILLVFFMISSIYLNLDQIPAVEQSEGGSTAAPAGKSSMLMVRLAADGRPVIRGQALTPEAFTAAIAERLAQDPATQVVILPSGEAPLQALVTVMDGATAAGAARLRVIRLEARP